MNNPTNNNIIIECPHCNNDNKIFLDNTNCSKCNKSFFGIKFKKATTSILMTGLLVSSGFFGYKQYQTNSHRYPTRVEFSIIDQCVSGSGQIIPREYVSQKLQICLLSLENTQKNISYSDFNNNKDKFDKEFQKNTYEATRSRQSGLATP